ncbi:mitochondrial 54S ribosomal protein uL22m [Magnusiomyces paraingens]|uniref:Ribosomal protein L22 n=1 Tax=Magnusiomyces paraingens TaxID=2606893 RepID=A0A5E8C717_9ASCO|nr:uncharacterized protein SAPINGB_P006395 [Saprochaete ingens]VVT58810.1 unnamed protein product [Saprochaete ingens]
MLSRSLTSCFRQLSISAAPTQCRTAAPVLRRALHSSAPVWKKTSTAVEEDQQSTSSLFGDITTPTGSTVLDTVASRAGESQTPKKKEDGSEEEEAIDYTKVDFTNDPDVLAHNFPKPEKPTEILLSPLKREIYEAAIAQYGSYSPKQIITLPDGRRFKLSLTREELEFLQPSVYLTSVRIKGSYKKGTVFTRLLREMDLKQAITQCHFSKKRMARDVGEMLTRGIDHAKKLEIDPEQLYISQIWVGKEPFIQKRVHFKGRGRSGIMHHPYIHIKAILKTKQTKQEFEQAKKDRIANRKVWQQHHNAPIKVYRGSNQYQW